MPNHLNDGDRRCNPQDEAPLIRSIQMAPYNNDKNNSNVEYLTFNTLFAVSAMS